jgi:hypothetical protein
MILKYFRREPLFKLEDGELLLQRFISAIEAQQ